MSLVPLIAKPELASEMTPEQQRQRITELEAQKAKSDFINQVTDFIVNQVMEKVRGVWLTCRQGGMRCRGRCSRVFD